MHLVGIGAGDLDRVVAISGHQRMQFGVRDPRQHGGIGDLVAVQMQDRQHRAVGRRVEELVAVPGGRQRPGLGLPVADDAGGDQVGIVQHRAVGVRQRVAQFAALMDRARRVRRGMAGDAAGEGELAEQVVHALGVARHVRDRFRCRCPPARCWRRRRARRGPGPAMKITIKIARRDDPVEMEIEEIQPRRGAPVAEQPRLDVLHPSAVRAAADWPADRSGRPTDSSPRATTRSCGKSRRRASAGRLRCHRVIVIHARAASGSLGRRRLAIA